MFFEKKPKYKKAKLINLNGVSGKVKKFDQNLHSKYDIEARNVLKNIFGENIKDNDDIYGEDMIFTIKNNPHPTNKQFPYKYLEVQVFSKWTDDEFPYNYPFVYARKMRFSNETLFVTFNKYFTEVLIFSKNSVDKMPSKLKKYDRESVHLVKWYKTMRLKTNQLTIHNIWLYYGEILNEPQNEPQNEQNEPQND